MTYSSYNLTDPQHFKVAEYPLVSGELKLLSQALFNIPGAHKADIFISFLKDHYINAAWVADSPSIVRLALSGVLSTSHIERLFTSCRQNTGFLQEFEDYFKDMLSENDNGSAPDGIASEITVL
jgi:hypothetical protein